MFVIVYGKYVSCCGLLGLTIAMYYWLCIALSSWRALLQWVVFMHLQTQPITLCYAAAVCCMSQLLSSVVTLTYQLDARGTKRGRMDVCRHLKS